MCSSGYEVFHTSETGLTSDPVYHHHDDYIEESAKQKEFDLSGFKRISPTPKFTLSHLYISPEDAEPHFTRSVSQSKNGYGDGYSAFIQNNFQNNDNDEEVNVKYPQKNYYDGDDGDDEQVNSKYRHVPKDDGEENEHYYNTYNSDELDRTQSLPQKDETETKHNIKFCKIIVKDKAMCRLCKDPVSGAHSESCSFSSVPPEKKYAYIKKEEYNS